MPGYWEDGPRPKTEQVYQVMHLGYLVHAFCSQAFRAGLKKIKPSKSF